MTKGQRIGAWLLAFGVGMLLHIVLGDAGMPFLPRFLVVWAACCLTLAAAHWVARKPKAETSR